MKARSWDEIKDDTVCLREVVVREGKLALTAQRRVLVRAALRDAISGRCGETIQGDYGYGCLIGTRKRGGKEVPFVLPPAGDGSPSQVLDGFNQRLALAAEAGSINPADDLAATYLVEAVLCSNPMCKNCWCTSGEA